MRRFAFVLVLAILGACNADDVRGAESTAPPTTERTTTTSTMAATTTLVSSTTSVAHRESDDGSESIGVTDRVTIVITDPADG